MRLCNSDTSIGSEFEYGNDKGEQPKTGDGIKEGAYTLNQGIIQLNYSNGAEAIIEAPASLVISDKLMTCSQGKVSVYAPEEAKNFIKNSGMDIIDPEPSFLFGLSQINLLRLMSSRVQLKLICKFPVFDL